MTTNTALTGEWLHSLLTGLGNTADEVAATLRAADVKGYRTDVRDDPGARFIASKARELVPATAQVDVILTAEEAVIGITPVGPDDYWEVSANTPEAVEDFLDGFDAGDYDDLAETPSA